MRVRRGGYCIKSLSCTALQDGHYMQVTGNATEREAAVVSPVRLPTCSGD
jgi:hypothetical protein